MQNQDGINNTNSIKAEILRLEKLVNKHERWRSRIITYAVAFSTAFTVVFGWIGLNLRDSFSNLKTNLQSANTSLTNANSDFDKRKESFKSELKDDFVPSLVQKEATVQLSQIISFPIGTIISSTLDFTTFTSYMKSNPSGYFESSTSKWSPADGRNVEKSEYGKFHKNVPDLRGQFLRGHNQMFSTEEPNGYSNGRDIGQRTIIDEYSYQNCATGMPTKQFAGVVPIEDRYISEMISANYQSGMALKAAVSVPGNNWSRTVESGEGGDGGNKYSLSIKGASDHTNGNVTISGGDEETRPQNMAVFYYIRINQ